MRKALITSLLTLAGLFGLGVADPANADNLRVFVSVGDVYHRGGHPYYRHGDVPLYVTHHDHRPRYYYYYHPMYHRPYYRPYRGAYSHARMYDPGYREHGYGDSRFRDHEDYRDGDRHDGDRHPRR